MTCSYSNTAFTFFLFGFGLDEFSEGSAISAAFFICSVWVLSWIFLFVPGSLRWTSTKFPRFEFTQKRIRWGPLLGWIMHTCMFIYHQTFVAHRDQCLIMKHKVTAGIESCSYMGHLKQKALGFCIKSHQGCFCLQHPCAVFWFAMGSILQWYTQWVTYTYIVWFIPDHCSQ